MRGSRWIALATAGAVLAACSSPAPEKRAVALPAAPPEGPRITQFYTTMPVVGRGEKPLVCYGVENARAVWLEPPRHELSVAQARCVDVSPKAGTTYKLTAQGAAGNAVTRELKVKVGAPRARLVNV